jgi:hypothetical protein
MPTLRARSMGEDYLPFAVLDSLPSTQTEADAREIAGTRSMRLITSA